MSYLFCKLITEKLVTVISKYFDIYLIDFLPFLSKNKVHLDSEAKNELTSGLRAAISSIRYALQSHKGKRELTFGYIGGDIDSVSNWLYHSFLNIYYAELDKKTKLQIENIYNLYDNISEIYCYGRAFNKDDIWYTAYSETYQYSLWSKLIDLDKGKTVADKIFETILPELLNAYTKLFKMLKSRNIIA